MNCDSMPEVETVVDYLLQMFPGTVDRDVIAAVVESCAGDLDHSTDALLTIMSGNQCQLTSSDTMASNEPHVTQHGQTTTSYAAASKNVAVVNQNNERSFSKEGDRKGSQNREQLKNIIYYYNKGYKILILMRGLPGCGKSYLAKLILDKTVGPCSSDHKKHILSTDDFFVNNQGYSYNKFSIPEAHNWNQNRVRQAVNSGLSPIIVDNTNVEPWEMEVYVKEAASEGYIIEIVEPQTSWARNLYELTKRNIHGVPLHKIKMMAERYQRHVTTSSIMKDYKIAYPANKTPPQMRSLPVLKDNIKHDCFLPSNMSSTVSEQPDTENVMKPQITQTKRTTTSSKHTTVNRPMLNDNLESCIDNSVGDAHLPLEMTTSRHNDDLAEDYGKQDDPNNFNPKPEVHCFNTGASLTKQDGPNNVNPRPEVHYFNTGASLTKQDGPNNVNPRPEVHCFNTGASLTKQDGPNKVNPRPEVHCFNTGASLTKQDGPNNVNPRPEVHCFNTGASFTKQDGPNNVNPRPEVHCFNTGASLTKQDGPNNVNPRPEVHCFNTGASLTKQDGPNHVNPRPEVHCFNTGASLTKQDGPNNVNPRPEVHCFNTGASLTKQDGPNNVNPRPEVHCFNTGASLTKQDGPNNVNPRPEVHCFNTGASLTKQDGPNNVNPRPEVHCFNTGASLTKQDGPNNVNPRPEVHCFNTGASHTKQDGPNNVNPRPDDHCIVTDSSPEKYNKREYISPLSRDSSIEELMMFSESEPWEIEAERKSIELYETFEVIAPKPKRVYKKRERKIPEKMLPSAVNDWDEWDNITKYMPSWDIQQPSTSKVIPTSKVVTDEKQTSVEQNDFKNDNLKCLMAVSRDINIDYNFREETEIKIPKKLMLDKSSSTHQRMSLNLKTTSEDIHYQENNLNEEIFDFCDGCNGCNNDVEWSINFFIDNNHNSVEIHLDSNPEVSNETYNSPCICALNFIKRINTLLTKVNKIKNNTDTTFPSQQQKKRRRWKNSAAGSKLKEELEKNVVINGYSKDMQLVKTNSIQHNYDTNTMTANEVQFESSADTSASDSFEAIDVQGTSNNETPTEESFDITPEISVSGDDTSEENISVTLGSEFVKSIDDKFGRSNFNYPTDIQPVVAMSKSMLEEINALWVESLSHQLSCMPISPEVLQKEDEDLARALSEMEEEYEINGMEPKVPDLADIMEMESALQLQYEEPADVRNNMPNDMASIMTRNKLFNLFPDQDQDDLLEVFAAHDNNFLVTIEVLLTSMGRNDILEEEDGVKKFIYNAELERQSTNLAVEKEKVERPHFSQERHPVKATDLVPFNQYRTKANAHLRVRNQSVHSVAKWDEKKILESLKKSGFISKIINNFLCASVAINPNMVKARVMSGRGIAGMADYYKSVAMFHKLQYEQANGMAVSSFVNHMEHTKHTVDLHFMYVPEALNCFDMFIDGHIEDLRSGSRNRTEGVTVFAITGRGLHSVRGTPRIKPAVLERLSVRDLESFELNPGLIGVFVHATSLLSHEVDNLYRQTRMSGGNLRKMIADFKKTL